MFVFLKFEGFTLRIRPFEPAKLGVGKFHCPWRPKLAGCHNWDGGDGVEVLGKHRNAGFTSDGKPRAMSDLTYRSPARLGRLSTPWPTLTRAPLIFWGGWALHAGWDHLRCAVNGRGPTLGHDDPSIHRRKHEHGRAPTRGAIRLTWGLVRVCCLGHQGGDLAWLQGNWWGALPSCSNKTISFDHGTHGNWDWSRG